MMTEKQAVSTIKAPQAIGPYSQAIVAGGCVYVSGQLALVPGTNALVSPNVAEQTRQVLQNVSAILSAAGSSLSQVVQATVYVTDLSQFPAINQVYAEYFPDPAPARATVEVSALPLGAQVEITVIALVG